MSEEPRTAWDEVRDIADSLGYQVFFDHTMVHHPPKVCEPAPVDWDWPPNSPMPDETLEQGEIQTCRVHHDEYWPCQAFREGRGVTPQPPTIEQRFNFRPMEDP